ncbi:hypothetical protein QKU48_gp0755 [Fadolivirus algeromassiliense]|jgi:hypothetical protein|uniref:Uncharacterized protein n=1 Tax=Fadolivirus FV1/VV64 TaxID=3070911 RepID=A0A7D3UQZ9_9VIRU|nr:hypothetical protein QKU48_gp0755 [Fadolivirus algeromassiliense]QKF94213.1 hypothetical protein Fadolivirus_1_755 [Fadolivirus FV1/VV64]
MLGLILFYVLYNTTIYGFTIALITILPFWLAYSIGMSEYARLNNIGTREQEKNRVLNSLIDEWDEFIVECENKNIFNALMEFGDFIHTFIKYATVCYLPVNTMNYPLFWFLIFWFIQPNSFKHGKRYFMNGCIRNHSNSKNLDHKCKYGKVFGILEFYKS